ncbi:MAG: hypothetical protein RI564_03665 [Gracilimonas sp.]|nr:hypothetical protein [Gracilimonas sp.]
MDKLRLYSLIGILSIAIIGCNLLTAENPTLDYPTTYPVISLPELEAMNSEYQSANDNRICSTLNEYGFTGFSEILFLDGTNPCDRANRDVVRVEMNEPDTLLKAAQKALLKNSEYTGVTDSSALFLKDISPQPGCVNCGRPDEYSANIEWRLTFGRQLIDSTEVPGTEIIVFFDALGVNRIWGNWYPNVTIPNFVNYGYAEVQAGMVGWQIDMRPYTGESKIYTIKAEDLTERPTKVLVPYENVAQERLEIRYCWAVQIDHPNEEFDGWTAYIDIEEGILVKLTSR